MRNTIAAFAVFLVASAAAPATAQVRNLGAITFSPPDGFKYDEPSSRNDAAVMTSSGPDGFFQIVVFPAFRSQTDLDGDFAIAWRRHLAGTFGRQPPKDRMFDYQQAGYPGRSASASGERTGFGRLYVLRAHGNTIPVAVLANTSGSVSNHSVVLELFLDGIRISPDQAQPAKRTIRVADIVGEWHEGGDSSVNWVDAFGSYAGTTFVAHGVTYVVAPDGTFQSRFAGISNGTILREKASGRIELQGDLLVLRQADTRHESRYRIISYQEAVNGVAVLTLLEPQYQPYAANIRLYGEKWYRRPLHADEKLIR